MRCYFLKSRKSIINAVFSLVSTVVLSALSLISTNLILKCYGSDFNGVVATASQVITILLLLEGGITTATNFALYKPYVDGDYKKINAILTKTAKQFFKIGLLLFTIGFFIALFYPFFIKSELPYIDIMLIILMVICSTTFNIIFTTKYNVLFQASQNEYYLTICNFVSNILTYIITIILVLNKANMLLVRLNITVGTIVNGIFVYLIFKKKFPLANYKSKVQNIHYYGLKDIIIQKFTGVVYSTAPIMFISSFVGTVYSSVYSVYNSIFSIVKTVAYSIVSAPSNGFGQMFSSNDNQRNIYNKFVLYQLIVTMILSILIASVLSVIIPFMQLYTRNVTDVNYIDYLLAFLFSLTLYVEIIHCPAGTIIGVAGHFKSGKNIQLIAIICLVPLLFIGALLFKVYGIMLSVLLTGVLLAWLEIYYVHTKIFHEKIEPVLKIVFLNFILLLIEFLFWYVLDLKFDNYFIFLVKGGVVLIVNAIFNLIVNKIFFSLMFDEIVKMVKNLFVNIPEKNSL